MICFFIWISFRKINRQRGHLNCSFLRSCQARWVFKPLIFRNVKLHFRHLKSNNLRSKSKLSVLVFRFFGSGSFLDVFLCDLLWFDLSSFFGTGAFGGWMDDLSAFTSFWTGFLGGWATLRRSEKILFKAWSFLDWLISCSCWSMCSFSNSVFLRIVPHVSQRIFEE